MIYLVDWLILTAIKFPLKLIPLPLSKYNLEIHHVGKSPKNQRNPKEF
jgi:hypothetical protein